MPAQLPVIQAKKLIRFLHQQGFFDERQSGSHLTLKHPDGRIVTVPVHTGKDIGKELLKKIITQASFTIEEFNKLR